jgi:hypothetical protein
LAGAGIPTYVAVHAFRYPVASAAVRRGRLMAFDQHPPGRRRARLYQIIFEADTPAGKVFDVVLIVAIVLSVLAVMLESVAGIRERHLTLLRAAEWVFTILFTVEYLLRLVAVRSPRQYALSFFGVVDLLAIVPIRARSTCSRSACCASCGFSACSS